MTVDSEENKTDLSEHFGETHGAQVIPAYFSSPKMAVGEAYVVENKRIKPSEEDYEKVFGLHQEQFNLLTPEQQEARKEDFVAEQTRRFQDAYKRTITTYENYLSDSENAPIEVRDLVKEVLETEIMILKENSIPTKIQDYIASGNSAEVALDNFYEEQISSFLAMNDEYLKARATELGQHRATMQHHLHPDKTLTVINDVRKGDILIMSSVSLSAISALCDPETGKKKVNGVIVDEGSLESHAAIIIDALGIPYSRIKQDDMDHIKSRDAMVMDGAKKEILLHPNKTVVKGYEGEVEKRSEQFDVLAKDASKKKSVKTRDGTRGSEKVNIHANYALSFESHRVRQSNPVSIGLYRTEILADMRYDKSSQTYHLWAGKHNYFEILKYNLANCTANENGYIEATIRTPDLAGDKYPVRDENGNIDETRRAKDQKILTDRLIEDMVLLAKNMEEEGHKPKLKIMVPMVNSNADIDPIRQMIQEECKKQGVKTKIPVGAMIETVAGVHALRKEKLNADFISVGTNDLIAKIIGPDRYSDENLESYDPTEPAVLEALKEIATAANEQNLPVSVCGEMASHTRYTSLLLGAGFRNLSVGVDSIPYIKKVASRIDIAEAEQLFDAVSNADKPERKSILADYNERHGFPHSGDVQLSWAPPEDKWKPDIGDLSQ